MENDEEHAQKAAPDSHFEKLAGIGHNGRREQERRGHGDKALTKGHIFKDWPIGKPTELLEQCATNEERLVPIDDPASDAAEIV